MADVNSLAAEAHRLKSIPEPQEVVVVRAKVSPSNLFATFVVGVVAVLIRGGLVSWAATHVEVVPDFGYVEAVFVCLFVGWVVPTSRATSWTRPWAERARGAYDRANAALKRAMKRAVDKAAGQ